MKRYIFEVLRHFGIKVELLMPTVFFFSWIEVFVLPYITQTYSIVHFYIYFICTQIGMHQQTPTIKLHYTTIHLLVWLAGWVAEAG